MKLLSSLHQKLCLLVILRDYTGLQPVVNKVFGAGSSVISQVQKSCFFNRFSGSVTHHRPLFPLHNTSKRECHHSNGSKMYLFNSFGCSHCLASVLNCLPACTWLCCPHFDWPRSCAFGLQLVKLGQQDSEIKGGQQHTCLSQVQTGKQFCWGQKLNKVSIQNCWTLASKGGQHHHLLQLSEIKRWAATLPTCRQVQAGKQFC